MTHRVIRRLASPGDATCPPRSPSRGSFRNRHRLPSKRSLLST